MGSTGSGNFSDYNGFKGNNPKQGGKGNLNECGKAFTTDLEDVEVSSYYLQNNDLPPVMTTIIISFNGTRIVACSKNGIEIGNLPTKFNYLLACLEEFSYSGIVTNISTTPIINVTINVTPDE